MEIQTSMIEHYIGQAVQAGVPRDQIENFIRAGYIAQPMQLLFHAQAREADRATGPRLIGLGGSRGPGKSHAIMAQVGLDDCQRIPGLKVLFLRKVKRTAAESMEDLTSRIFQLVPHTYREGKITFPNGSRILIGGFKDESDIDTYLGIEYDVIVIEEATLLTRIKRDYVEGSLRTSKSNWRPRMYLSTNPGEVGHLWFKDEFIIPFRTGQASNTVFIPGTYKDNKYLDEGYVEFLLRLQGPLGKAWREGDWDAFEGMAFPSWNETDHIIDPFEIPSYFVTWTGIDWGYAAPWCILWLAQDPRNGRIYVYREIYEREVTDQDQAKLIRASMDDAEQTRILYNYADPSLWQRKNYEGKVTSTADEYRKNGVPLVQADNDRLSGKRKVDRLLGRQQDGEPGLQIFRTCTNLIRTLPALPLSKTRPEDVDTNAEDHAYDALRYALTKFARPQDPRHQTNQEAPLRAAGGLI